MQNLEFITLKFFEHKRLKLFQLLEFYGGSIGVEPLKVKYFIDKITRYPESDFESNNSVTFRDILL